MKALTPKQRLFAKEYVKDLNATEAAVRAGYSEKSASVLGSRMIRAPHILEFVDSLLAEQNRASGGITAERVVAELGRIAFGDEHPTMARVRCLEILAKRFGLLRERVEHSIEGGGTAAILKIPLDAAQGLPRVQQIGGENGQANTED